MSTRTHRGAPADGKLYGYRAVTTLCQPRRAVALVRKLRPSGCSSVADKIAPFCIAQVNELRTLRPTSFSSLSSSWNTLRATCMIAEKRQTVITGTAPSVPSLKKLSSQLMDNYEELRTHTVCIGRNEGREHCSLQRHFRDAYLDGVLLYTLRVN